MTNDESITNNEIGERGRLARSFRRPAEKPPMVSREARDTAGGAPAAPRFVIFLRDSSSLRIKLRLGRRLRSE